MIVVLDCETTGLDNATETVVEVAAVGVVGTVPQWVWSSLVNPGKPIPPAASAIHHILDSDVTNASSLARAMLTLSTVLSLAKGPPPTLAAHNAKFDGGFLHLPINICTWRCATHVWPEAPSHGNQALRYWLPGLNDELMANTLSDYFRAGLTSLPHRALPDAWVTAHILLRLLKEHPVEELVQLTKTPILFRTVNFGMHRGTLWSEVPKSYLRWLLGQDFDPDTKYTARYHLDAVPPPLLQQRPYL